MAEIEKRHDLESQNLNIKNLVCFENIFFKWMQGDQKISKNICLIFLKIPPKVTKSMKVQNIYNKAQFESPKHLR